MEKVSRISRRNPRQTVSPTIIILITAGNFSPFVKATAIGTRHRAYLAARGLVAACELHTRAQKERFARSRTSQVVSDVCTHAHTHELSRGREEGRGELGDAAAAAVQHVGSRGTCSHRINSSQRLAVTHKALSPLSLSRVPILI